MRYVICPRCKAETRIQLAHHVMDGESVALNEKEVMFCPQLEGETLEARAEQLDGEICSLAEVKTRFLI